MQVLDSAFLAPAAPVQRTVATSRSLERSKASPRSEIFSALAPALAVGTLLGATAAFRGAQRSQASKARRRQGPPATTLNPEEDVKTDSWGEKFVWQKAWYPMAVIEDLDPLGVSEDLVAWVDGDGEWRVFEDRCPHRAVPLSEGRIEKDGTLMCSYHGWRFNGEGKVTAIPQATELLHIAGMSLLEREMPSHGRGEAPMRPHAKEVRSYLAILRLCDFAFYGGFLLLSFAGVYVLGMLSLAAALLGSLLLQQDPFLHFLGRPMAQALDSLDWAKWAWSDGWTYLLPLLGTSCLASLLGLLGLIVSVPSHSTGVLGYLRPLALILVSSAHVFTAACCWHIHGLVFRPHGGVSYTEIFPTPRMEAQLDLTPVPQADDYLPPGPPPRVEAVPLQSQIARPVHSDIPQADAPQLPTSAVDSADPAGATCAEPQKEAPEVCTADAAVPTNESNAAPAEAVTSEAPEAESGYEVCNIEVLIRLPSGRRLRSSFLSTDPISKLYDAVEAESGREPEIRDRLGYKILRFSTSNCSGERFPQAWFQAAVTEAAMRKTRQREKFPELQQNARACASARPAQVWGESGENAALEAALQEPNIPPEAEDPAYEGRAKFSVWSHRDVPYGWEVAFENVTDPAHVAVAHHNIVSNRYEDPCPLKIDWVRKPSNKEGFKYTIEQVGKNIVTTMDFKPPSQMHIRTSYDEKSGASLTLVINFIPTKPGWSRLVGTTQIVTGENGEKPDGFAIYSAPLPRWVSHLLGPLFLHQDQVFLHYQQIILEKERRKW
ncbi:PAO, partial [Symbiodinium sp. KB8]